MDVGDSAKSYTSGFWNYGVEAWCNLEGQYFTIVADLSSLSGDTYEMTICSLGIFGVEYVRTTAAPTSVELE